MNPLTEAARDQGPREHNPSSGIITVAPADPARKGSGVRVVDGGCPPTSRDTKTRWRRADARIGLCRRQTGA
jgi:hypothetical protein